MRPLYLSCGIILLVVGCSAEPEPSGPGRFPCSAFHETIAPWDGPAVQLYLVEAPMPKRQPIAPCLAVRIYQAASQLSTQRMRLEGKESRAGHAQWLAPGGDNTTVQWVEIDFEEIKKGEPVRGKYDAAFSDGGRARGRFEAEWWPSEGRGG